MLAKVASKKKKDFRYEILAMCINWTGGVKGNISRTLIAQMEIC